MLRYTKTIINNVGKGKVMQNQGGKFKKLCYVCNLSLGAVSECAMDLCVAMAWTFQVGCQRIFLLGEAQWLLHPSYINPHTDMLYLQKVSGAMGCGNNNNGGESVVLGTVDVKDSFFMVDQVTPMAVSLLGRTYKVKKNLPGQRLSARAWYWAFRETLVRNLACHGAPNSHAWLEINSAEVLQSAFTVARCWMWDAVLEKNLEACWYRFGFGSRNKRHEGGWDVATAAFKLRTAVIFSVVPMPAPYAFRSVIGIRWTRSSFLLWRSWVAQFSSLHTAVGRLRKLIGYLKTTSDFCLNGRAARSIGFLRRSLTLIGLDTNHTGDPPHEEFMPQRWLPLFKQCCQP